MTAQALRAGHPVAPAAAADGWLMMTLAMLLGFGLVMVFSASIPGHGADPFVSLVQLARHGLHIAVGVIVLLIAQRLPLSFWQRSGPVLILVSLLLLALVLVDGVGRVVNGSARWLEWGGLRLQPSEFAKLFLVLYIAGYLTRRREQLVEFRAGILMIGLVVGVVATLLLLEPDFGSVVVLIAAAGGMIFLAGVRFRHFVVCLLATGAAMAALVLVSPYRLERITAFMNPWSDPFDSGFQLVQALIAFGRGEWFGVGLGASIQKLHYLPAANTDFLLAVIGEELGLVGVLAVVGLFAILVWRAFVIARRAEQIGEVFGARLAEGVGLLIGAQAMINIGVNLGVLPTKGLTLPFMSYGGSSLVAFSLAAGLLLCVDRHTRPRAGGAR